jgi:hypothetical protein
MTTGELIAWYFATGHSIEEIRATFPAFFPEPAPEPRWNSLDWLNLWQDQTHDHFLAYEQDVSGPSLYPHL